MDILVPSGGWHSSHEEEVLGVVYPYALALLEENARLSNPEAGISDLEKARTELRSSTEGSDRYKQAKCALDNLESRIAKNRDGASRVRNLVAAGVSGVSFGIPIVANTIAKMWLLNRESLAVLSPFFALTPSARQPSCPRRKSLTF